jgi:hypothetical protein
MLRLAHSSIFLYSHFTHCSGFLVRHVPFAREPGTYVEQCSHIMPSSLGYLAFFEAPEALEE